MPQTFPAFFQKATGKSPYPYQCRLACEESATVEKSVAPASGTINVKDHIKKLRKRDAALEAYWRTNCPLVAKPVADGKIRPIRAASTDSFLRIIQSIPSPKAEPFKLSLIPPVALP